MTADVAAFIDLLYYDNDFNTLFAQNDLIAVTSKHNTVGARIVTNAPFRDFQRRLGVLACGLQR